MKKLIYSKFTKFIVWLLIIALTVPLVDVVYNGLKDYMELGGDTVYAFSKDFESSYYVAELLSIPIDAVAFSYMDSRIESVYTVHGNGSVSAQHREYIAVTIPTDMPSFEAPVTAVPDPEATPVPTLTPRPASELSETQQQKEEIYALVEERISDFAEDERIDYYIKVNDKVYTNTDESLEQLVNRELSYYAYRAPDGSGERSWNGYNGRLTGFGNYSIDTFGEDEITVCTAIVDSHADQMRQVWLRQEQMVKESFEKLIVILGIILLLSVYLLATAGIIPAGADKRGMMDKLWTEIYLAAAAGAGIGGIALTAALFYELFEEDYGSYYGGIPEYMALPLVYITAALTVFIVLGSIIMCVRKLRQNRFLADSVVWALALAVWKIAKYILIFAWDVFKKTIRAVYIPLKSGREILRGFIGKKTGRYILASVTVFAFIMWLCGILTPDVPLFLFVAIVVLAAAIYFLYKRTKELDEIKSGAASIRRGQLSYKIAQPHSPDLVSLASDINHIAQGLDESVAAKLKAERMKTELITNVSHDLKTPLTSMISYTELLSQVEGLPDEAQDYIKIIASKSERLKKLTQDLFDISKVQSGSESITLEKLDAALLIEQSLAEHESEIELSKLNFIVNTEKQLFFMADGKKMSRVTGNLIENILKYSMSGTRVFISARELDGRVMMEFKNMASYLMEFDPEEIVGRFVRGDEARSTEGSGLGLAIAKSYVEACGGSFSITVDGDLFKVNVSFEKI